MTELDPVLAFGELTPDQMLDAVESSFLSDKGQFADGTFLALNSYENRVYQVGVEDDSPLVAKFYRPARWSDKAILEEHAFTIELADAEIPVIPPLRGSSGDTLFVHGPFRLALYPCRGGRSLELDNEVAFVLAVANELGFALHLKLQVELALGITQNIKVDSFAFAENVDCVESLVQCWMEIELQLL